MSTRCEIVLAAHGGCGLAAVDWCRACDRAMCAAHRQRLAGRPSTDTICGTCSDALAVPRRLAEQTYRCALEDIPAAIAALRAAGCPGAQVATKKAAHRSLRQPWTTRIEPVYSLRYWSVGSFHWVESLPGGYGEHDLLAAGVRERATVVNERGQITRAAEGEILAGHATLARLQSEFDDVPEIARMLRSYLTR